MLLDAFIAVTLYKYDETAVEKKVLQTVDLSASSVYNSWLKINIDKYFRRETQYSYSVTKVSSNPIGGKKTGTTNIKQKVKVVIDGSAMIIQPDDTPLESGSESSDKGGSEEQLRLEDLC
jgi:hypothetical protein